MQQEFRPPEAILAEPDASPARSSIAAVLLGGLVVDFLGTIVGSILVVLAFVGVVRGTGGGEAEIAAALESTRFLVVVTGLGALLSLAGGYVAARWARRRPVAHGACAGALSLVIGLPFLLLPGALDPLWLTATTLAAQIPLAAAGGHLAGRRGA